MLVPRLFHRMRMLSESQTKKPAGIQQIARQLFHEPKPTGPRLEAVSALGMTRYN